MSAPTPESLSMDCGLKCEMCSAAVNYGDDYVAHLALAHQITKSIPYFMDKALAAVKGEKRKAAEVFIIEEEPDIHNSSPLEPGGFDKFELDLETRASLEKTIENTMDDLFKPLKLILEGKVPLDDEEIPNDLNEEEESFSGSAEDKLWQSFDNLKEVINNMEFPLELLQQIADERNTNANIEDEKLLNDKSGTLEELCTGDKNKDIGSNFKIPQPMKENSDKVNLEETISLPPTNNLLPVRSDKSDISTASSVSSTSSSSGHPESLQTNFLCPVKPCNFSTTKHGMKEGIAAKHLSKVHLVTGAVMKKAAPGTYKFRKVKGEK